MLVYIMLIIEEGTLLISTKALGKFLLSDGINILNDDVLRSDMLKKLIIYILVHRERPITTQELADALWDEDVTDNPTGALKNLMYRLRNILKTTFGDNKFILTSPGAYCWNSDVEVTLDVEEFENYVKLAKNASDEQTAIDNYEQALEFYRGDFMDNVLDKHWAVTLATYYHSLFLTTTKELAELYQKNECFQDMEHICMNGLRYDRVDEQLHCYYITALIKQNKLELAMKNFEEATKTLYEALGVRNSEKLKEVQAELLKMNTGETEQRMENIHEDMAEDGNLAGVYMCGYPVFREIYRLEARKISRLGEAEYVVLLTVEMNGNTKADNDKMEQFVTKKAMKQLEEALKETLRIGDVAARYSERQYVILLPTCTYESSVAVAKRIVSSFNNKNKNKMFIIKTEFEQVTAAKSALVR